MADVNKPCPREVRENYVTDSARGERSRDDFKGSLEKSVLEVASLIWNGSQSKVTHPREGGMSLQSCICGRRKSKYDNY